MDKRKKMICVLDTETLGVDQPLVYDLGISITDKQGNICFQKNWIVKEVFSQKEKMQSAYYAWKLPKYDEMIANGQAIVTAWNDIKTEFAEIMDKYNVKVVSAYNMGFDKRALTYTNKCLGNKDKFLKRSFEIWDIWGMATQTILRQATYRKVAQQEGWFTPKGNLLTNAEVSYRYITNKLGFVESHTALHDTEIETAILAKCIKQHKKMDKSILPNPWRLAQVNA